MSDDHDYLRHEPGMVPFDGAAAALVEQQRASIIQQLRTTKAASVTVMDADGGSEHWGVFLENDHHDAETFLCYAAVRAVRDASAAMGVDHARTCQIVLDAIERGVGS